TATPPPPSSTLFPYTTLFRSEVDPEREITVCCGSTETIVATMLAICNKGDEVIVFEPFYENYGPDSIISGAKPRFVSLRPPTASDRKSTRLNSSHVAISYAVF